MVAWSMEEIPACSGMGVTARNAPGRLDGAYWSGPGHVAAAHAAYCVGQWFCMQVWLPAHGWTYLMAHWKALSYRSFTSEQLCTVQSPMQLGRSVGGFAVASMHFNEQL